MKSKWLWLAGAVIAIWIFSVNKQGKTSTPTQFQHQQTYQQPAYSAPTFMGYPCGGDCSGHEAGYEWAEENEVNDPDDCDGNSDSFIEGCQAYAEEQQAEAEGNSGNE